MVDSVVPSKEPKEPTTVTSDQIVYQQRVRVLAHSRETGNVAATCRVFGISRKTFYKWRNTASLYGLEALWPKKKRLPMMPNATPTHIVETLLTMAVTAPGSPMRPRARPSR